MNNGKVRINNVKNRIQFLPVPVQLGKSDEYNLNNFKLIRELGKGAFGLVILAIDKETNIEYALKKVERNLIIKYKMQDYLRREVKIMYECDHPNIIRLFSHFEDQTDVYLVTEYAEKGQLYGLVKKYGRIDEKSAARYIQGLVQSQDYLHSRDPPIIHRDIKGENILLTATDELKLADFGWANLIEKDTERQTYCGTPEYLCPEVIDKTGHNEKNDIWCIGILLYELLTGHTPFKPLRAKTRQEQDVLLKQNIRKMLHQLIPIQVQRL